MVGFQPLNHNKQKCGKNKFQPTTTKILIPPPPVRPTPTDSERLRPLHSADPSAPRVRSCIWRKARSKIQVKHCSATERSCSGAEKNRTASSPSCLFFVFFFLFFLLNICIYFTYSIFCFLEENQKQQPAQWISSREEMGPWGYPSIVGELHLLPAKKKETVRNGGAILGDQKKRKIIPAGSDPALVVFLGFQLVVPLVLGNGGWGYAASRRPLYFPAFQASTQMWMHYKTRLQDPALIAFPGQHFEQPLLPLQHLRQDRPPNGPRVSSGSALSSRP